MKKLLIISLLLLAGCYQKSNDPDALYDAASGSNIKYNTIDGHKYLMQWQSNGREYRWIIVGEVK